MATNWTIRLDAKPEPIMIEPAKSAVIVVDMQNDFGAKGGMFDRLGVELSIIQRTITPTARVLTSARSAGIKIVYLKMGFLPDLSDVGMSQVPHSVRQMGVGKTMSAPDGSVSRILIRDTWNTDIVSELTPRPGDVVLYKTRYSGFYETNLDAILKDDDIRYLIVTGCTTSVCVESTIRDAMFRDYSCILLEDCTAEPIGFAMGRSNHEASLFMIETLFGWASSSDAFARALEEKLQPEAFFIARRS
jgi:ureidoacrylate peracid hydrolase